MASGSFRQRCGHSAACGLEDEGLGLASQLSAQGPSSVAGGESKAQGLCLIAGAGCGRSAKEGPPQTQKESGEQNLCLNHLLATSPWGQEGGLKLLVALCPPGQQPTHWGFPVRPRRWGNWHRDPEGFS